MGFQEETNMDGNVHTFKARLAAKGFTQTHGIDYDETFSPVAMLKSIRILMAISAYFNYEIWQMDVKTTFLNRKLTEDVYMEQPEGFEDPKNPNKVCKLLKSIYGLKQASRSWNLHFDERIKEFGFAKSEFEPCVYTKFSGSIVTFLVLYVDDILLIGNDVPTLQSVKSWMDESKKRFIPMQHGIVLSKTQCPVSSQDQDKMKSVPYASAIGSIMYAMLCTRPDVAYSVSVTSRYQQNPGEPHWVAVKNILKYLRITKDMFLVFGGSEDEISVTGYSDASFQTDRDDFRSQYGYIFTLNGGAISWKSSMQDTIADSTTEAECIAASDAAKEAVWLRNFLSELRVSCGASKGTQRASKVKTRAQKISPHPRDHWERRLVERRQLANRTTKLTTTKPPTAHHSSWWPPAVAPKNTAPPFCGGGGCYVIGHHTAVWWRRRYQRPTITPPIVGWWCSVEPPKPATAMVEIKTQIESHSGGDRLFYRTAAVVALVAAVIELSLIEPSIDGGVD
ncbi:hypothetical protein OSB04_011576 [Centaurea solstitialis]|uniref:Reverse transcriptase Ty1/copia-type domain-containing protein n=1 Tax=Centaurea solstitialis TaxID=347529 RepID=A0AA38TSS6_9ASTR|nr:hypothetical protein OSB04_011576 [Centaurea solstitialis]